MTTSFDKSKLKILLLEGIHPSAERIFRDAGYQNIETVKTALTGDELKSRLEGVHFLGIRSRATLTRDIFEAADKLVAVGCYCIGTNQVDLARRARPRASSPTAGTGSRRPSGSRG